MNKIMILLVVFLLIYVVPSFAYEAEIYEKNGCVYIVGHPTEEEKQTNLENYKQRMAERTRQVEAEIQRNHEIKIETIKAQAMRDYLIAQSMPLREVADAIGKIRFNQRVSIGDVISKSSSSATGGMGGQVINTNTNTNDNETDVSVDVKK